MCWLATRAYCAVTMAEAEPWPVPNCNSNKDGNDNKEAAPMLLPDSSNTPYPFAKTPFREAGGFAQKCGR